MIPAILSFAALAAAAPVVERQAITDVQILNYALTLEHLENAFYKMGVANYSAADFRAIGAGKNFYNNLNQISSDEQTHVEFLSTALGDSAVQPCTYAFPSTDPKSFLAVANILEGVGVSAYLGAAQFIMNKDYLTAAGSILTVESRHSAYLRSFNKLSPFPAPFDIPLDFNEVFSLASLFIVECPPSNPALPVKAFPALTASPATPAKAGDKISLTVAKSVNGKAAWFITSMGPVKAPLTGSGKSYSITVPAGAQAGQGYLVLTKNMNKPTDDNIVAGPAVIEIQDNISGMMKSAPPAGTPKGQSQSGSVTGNQQATDGQVQVIEDGQAQTGGAVSQMPDGQPISQIGDGQVQVNGQPATQIGDGQVQVNGQPVSQIGDGQVQVNGMPVTQIGDGQVQVQQGPPVTQIGDGQIQAPAAQQMPDGQVTNGGA